MMARPRALYQALEAGKEARLSAVRLANLGNDILPIAVSRVLQEGVAGRLEVPEGEKLEV